MRLGEIDLSADGARIAYERSTIDIGSDAWAGEIRIVPSHGGSARRVVAPDPGGARPRFSPDGRFLAFTSDRDGSSQVWLLPLAGGEPTRLTEVPGAVSALSWAADSGSLVVVARDGPAPAPPLVPADDDAVPISDISQPGAWEVAAPPATDPVVGDPADAVEGAAAAPSPDVETAGTGGPAAADGGAPTGVDSGRPLPRVIRRLQFKRDGEGYVGPRRDHLYVIVVPDLLAGPVEARRLTRGAWDASSPRFSPDGRYIALVANRTPSPDTNDNTEIWLASAEGGELVRVTEDPGADAAPVWSPDGRWLAFVHTPAEPPVYANPRLRIVEVFPSVDDDGTRAAEPAVGDPVDLTEGLDRPVRGEPAWAVDGTRVYVTVEDRGTRPLVRIGTGLRPMGEDRRGGLTRLFSGRRRSRPEDRGRVESVIGGPRAVGRFALLPEDEGVVALLSTATGPEEIWRAPLPEDYGPPLPDASPTAHLQPVATPPAASMSRVTSENRGWRERVLLAEPEPIRFASGDGTAIEGWLLRPPNAVEGARYPLVVRAHGGPVAQYDWAFSWDLQYLAAQGYVVLYVNPRGSSGYGEEFAHAIWADWGNLDAADIRAGVDHLVERGVVDSERIGVGGWSYGGILTNYLIAQDPRFDAAVSGASETHYLSAYGTDDLQRWWEVELGVPFAPEARALYDRLSPIYRAGEIRAATLLMVGELDWRVPLSQSEMLYTWLRRRQEDGGPPTGLIVYPGESHALQRPSFLLDRWRRTKAWFDRYVMGDESADPFFGEAAW